MKYTLLIANKLNGNKAQNYCACYAVDTTTYNSIRNKINLSTSDLLISYN